ncbi:hypothetical protein AB8E32_03355 [Marinomonas polaris]|jgi:phosphoketolase|uniref:hypothetical protein n=1 Tax=Marinomonas polaris TaxID=293552 RepID=UPI0035137B83
MAHLNVLKMTMQIAVLAPDQLGLMGLYWRAGNYLSVGHIYLHDSPFLTQHLLRVISSTRF